MGPRLPEGAEAAAGAVVPATGAALDSAADPAEVTADWMREPSIVPSPWMTDDRSTGAPFPTWRLSGVKAGPCISNSTLVCLHYNVVIAVHEQANR